MTRETPFLVWWRTNCPKLWLGEAIRVYALAAS
jgi:hypothetical protein